MGFSGDIQYLVPIGFVVILFKFVIIDFKKFKSFKYFILGIVLYTIFKVILLKYFHYNEDFIGMSIVMLVIALLFSYFRIYKKINKTNVNRDFDYELLLTHVKMGYFIGNIFIIFPFIIKIINLSHLYRGEIKNFYLLLFEYLLSGIIILLTSKLGSKIINNINN